MSRPDVRAAESGARAVVAIVNPVLFHASILDARIVGGVGILGLIVCLFASIAPIRTILRMQVMTTLREQ